MNVVVSDRRRRGQPAGRRDRRRAGVSDDGFERPPETLTGAARDLIRGAYKLDGRLLLILDTAHTVNVPAAGTLA